MCIEKHVLGSKCPTNSSMAIIAGTKNVDRLKWNYIFKLVVKVKSQYWKVTVLGLDNFVPLPSVHSDAYFVMDRLCQTKHRQDFVNRHIF
jgi:hypothetical protein